MNIAVCDDEKIARSILTSLIKACVFDAEIFEYSSGEALLNSNTTHDIIFLDIKMDKLTGIDAAQRLRKNNITSKIIFVTALKEYVFNAFDVGAFHYLLKPINKVKLLQVLNKALEEINSEANGKTSIDKNIKSIVIKKNNVSQKVFVTDIIYVEVFNRKVMLHTKKEKIEYYAKLKDLENELKNCFFRCHRAYLVNMHYILKYNYLSITLENGMELPLSKSKYKDFVYAYLIYIKGIQVENE